jgi:hypothetical protein
VLGGFLPALGFWALDLVLTVLAMTERAYGGGLGLGREWHAP